MVTVRLEVVEQHAEYQYNCVQRQDRVTVRAWVSQFVSLTSGETSQALKFSKVSNISTTTYSVLSSFEDPTSTKRLLQCINNIPIKLRLTCCHTLDQHVHQSNTNQFVNYLYYRNPLKAVSFLNTLASHTFS